VHCYGIPIHAWNNVFFVEMVSVLGRLLKIDDQTINKEMLDFARLHITSKILKKNLIFLKIFRLTARNIRFVLLRI